MSQPAEPLNALSVTKVANGVRLVFNRPPTDEELGDWEDAAQVTFTDEVIMRRSTTDKSQVLITCAPHPIQDVYTWAVAHAGIPLAPAA